MEQNYGQVIRYGKIENLRSYYQDKGLTLIGLNDSQSINKLLFRKGLLEYLSESLKSDEVDPVIINAFSLMFNKTEHINYLLESNLSLDEIKDLQVHGMVGALEKAMQDFHMPQFIGKIGYISRLLYRPKKGDENIFLTDTLKSAKEPIVIYSCGANDLMREVWNNPLSIGKDYKNRDKNMNYDYSFYKLYDGSAVKRVINSVEGNINNILTLNDGADIFTLGLYIPRSMQCDGMKIFNDAIDKYNEYLQEICVKYNLTYIDTENVAKSNDLCISNSGHNALVNEIIDELHNKKIWNPEPRNINIENTFKVQNHKILDLEKVEKESRGSFGIQNKVYEEMKREIERQIGVVEKVAIKRI